MIPKDIIDRIYSTARIEEVVSDYVSLKRRGASFWGLCPYPGHTEKTPSFCVTPAKNICKCFGCGRGGNAINFVMEMEQCSYPEALKKVAQKYHIEVPEREMTPEERQRQDHRESMLTLNEWANKFYQDQLWNSQDGQAIALSYFRTRGLYDETIRKFGLGFSPIKGYVTPKEAKESGYTEKYLLCDPETGIGTGICSMSSGSTDPNTGEQRKPSLFDRYHGRVMFPIHGLSGKIVGFAGRIIEKKDNVGKYVNSPESLIYSKKNQLYGLYLAKQAIAKQEKCYLVEGQMDCISMSQAGIENVVCSGGTALTKEQIRLIHRFTGNVTILYDGDAAGIHAALRGIDMFLTEGLNVKVMLFPDGEDPDSFAHKHTSEEFIQYIDEHEEDFINYKTRTLLADARNDARKRSEVVHSVVNSIALIGDRITREIYIKDCARMLDMPESAIRTEVIDVRKKNYQIEKTAREQKEQGATSNPVSGEPPIIGVDDEPTEGQETPVETPPAASEPARDPAQEQLYQNFINLIRAQMRYGERKLIFQNPDGTMQEIAVGDYIQQYIYATKIDYIDPLHQRIFSEWNEHKNDEGITAEAFYVQHSDMQISGLAADLLSEQYTLCRTYETNETEIEMNELIRLVIQLLYELHYSWIDVQLNALDQEMIAAGEANDMARQLECMSQQNTYTQLKKSISELLGKY